MSYELPGFTWARFARGNGPLSIYQHTFPVGDRGLAVVGSGVLVEQPSWNVGQRLQLLPPPALCSLTAWLRCRMSVGQRPWEHMPNSPVSRSNFINGSGRWYSFGASDSSTQNSVQCGWFLFTDWFKFLTHWSAITAFYMLSVLHETKCRRISFIKVMINSSTQNTVQCGWFYSRIWLKVSNSLVCNHSILHARGLHETKCWGIFSVSGLISLFSTEIQLQRKLKQSATKFLIHWSAITAFCMLVVCMRLSVEGSSLCQDWSAFSVQKTQLQRKYSWKIETICNMFT